MPDVWLLAVVHSDEGLIGQEMYDLMVSKILPLLDNDSVIVMEGGKKRGILKPGNPAYGLMMSQLGPILTSGIRPTIHADDPMWREEEAQILADRNQQEEYVCVSDAFLEFGDVPTTWDELILKIRGGKHDVTTKGALSDEWIKYARRRCHRFNLRDKVFAQQIRRHARRGKRVLFVGGLLHAINLSALHGWHVVRKACPPDLIAILYSHWYRSYAIEFLLR